MSSAKIMIMVFLVFGLLGMIRGLDPVTSGEEYMMHINVVNDGVKDLEDLSVRVYIYDLGIMFQTNSFDVDDGDSTGKIMLWDVPNDVEPGRYWARITASNDDERSIKHRLITVA